MKYSKSTNGFYDPLINDNIPTDAVDITDQNYSELMDGQSQGRMIVANADGYPTLVDRPKPTNEQLKTICKNNAKQKLADTDWSQTEDVGAILTNKDEFTAYRSVIRGLVFNPVPNPDWPVEPIAVWKE